MESSLLIELLNKEREYHSKHPQQVFVKFIYALGTSLAAIIASIYFSGKADSQSIVEFMASKNINTSLLFFCLGLILIFIGLTEHNYFHAQQREKVEIALNNIYETSLNFNFEKFWNQYSSHKLKSILKKNLRNSTPLFTLEPDTRNFWKFHDRKIEVGILFLVVAYGLLIYKAIS